MIRVWPGSAGPLGAIWDGEAEARYVAEEVEAIQRHGESLDHVAILVRA